MEQVESIPFSSLLAGMLLVKKNYTATEVADKVSKLEGIGIVVDDENDNLDILSCCMEIDSEFGFHLKKGIDYNTVICSDITVFEFLNIHTNEKVMSFLKDERGMLFSMEEEFLGMTPIQKEENCDFKGMENHFMGSKKRVRSLFI